MADLPEEVRVELEELYRPILRGKRESVLLGGGAAAAVILALLGWASYYCASVLSYAELNQNIEIRRDAIDPDRVTIYYTPSNSGMVGFGRDEGNCRTEALERVTPGSVGKRQKFHWIVGSLRTGVRIRVEYLDGWRLQTREIRVPPPGGSVTSG